MADCLRGELANGRQILDEMAPVRRHMNRLTGAAMGDEPPDEPQKGMALAMGPRAKAYPTNGSPNSLSRTATGSASAVEPK